MVTATRLFSSIQWDHQYQSIEIPLIGVLVRVREDLPEIPVPQTTMIGRLPMAFRFPRQMLTRIGMVETTS